MSNIIVTGGAGFIGSALVWALNQRGRSDIVIVDSVDHDEKEHNVAGLQYEEMMSGDDFRQKLREGYFNPVKSPGGDHGAGDKGVEAIFHLAAISATTEKSWQKLQDNNVDFSQEVIRWCTDNDVRCIYASSAATYGDGSQGYSDSHDLFNDLQPLNLYGKSKLLVDIWARDGGYLDKVVGLRYFNVFGPNEWHKEDMKSVMAKKYPDVAAGKAMTLFKSYDEQYPDGGQKRDFIYIKDVLEMTLFFFDNLDVAGVFNVGTGVARSWNDVAQAIFAATQAPAKIEYIEMPDDVRAHYQYFTQADMRKVRTVGCGHTCLSLEESVAEYVKDYLASHVHLS